MSVKTKSEHLFEIACDQLGVQWTRIPEDSTRTPDYSITAGGVTVYVEVKQLEDSEEDKKLLNQGRTKGSVGFFPASDNRLRRVIKDANSQLKQRTDGKFSGLLVVFAETIIGDYDSQDVHDAMFGNETYTSNTPSAVRVRVD